MSQMIFKCAAEDEHLLGRLGVAVVTQWSALSSEIHDGILREATMTFDADNQTTSLREQLIIFIRKHQDPGKT
jgi:hypothetical protein